MRKIAGLLALALALAGPAAAQPNCGRDSLDCPHFHSYGIGTCQAGAMICGADFLNADWRVGFGGDFGTDFSHRLFVACGPAFQITGNLAVGGGLDLLDDSRSVAFGDDYVLTLKRMTTGAFGWIECGERRGCALRLRYGTESGVGVGLVFRFKDDPL